ncbi:MAG: transposase [Flavobacteriales bacterium Tduv]
MHTKVTQVSANVFYFHSQGIKYRIQKKAYRKNRPLSRLAVLFNIVVSTTHWVVERTFGSIKYLFRSGKTRYKGLARLHAQSVMGGMEHNLYRASGIVISCS